jgi:hypothetical protein
MPNNHRKEAYNRVFGLNRARFKRKVQTPPPSYKVLHTPVAITENAAEYGKILVRSLWLRTDFTKGSYACDGAGTAGEERVEIVAIFARAICCSSEI